MGCTISAASELDSSTSLNDFGLFGSCCSVAVLRTQSALPISPNGTRKQETHPLRPSRESSSNRKINFKSKGIRSVGDVTSSSNGRRVSRHCLLPESELTELPVSMMNLISGTARFSGYINAKDGSKIVLNGMGQLDERGDGMYLNFVFPNIHCSMTLGPGLERISENPVECTVEINDQHFAGVTGMTWMNELGDLRVIEELELNLQPIANPVVEKDISAASGAILSLESPNPAMIQIVLDREEEEQQHQAQQEIDASAEIVQDIPHEAEQEHDVLKSSHISLYGSVSWKCWSHEEHADIEISEA